MEADSLQITPELLEQHPVLAVVVGTFGMMMLGGLAGSALAWAMVLRRWYQGKTVLPRRPWEPRRWGLIDLILTVAVFYCLQMLFFGLGVTWLDIDVNALRNAEATPPIGFTALVSLSNLGTVGIITAWIVARYRRGAQHAGWTADVIREVGIGMVAGLLVIPVVYVLSAVVSTAFDTKYAHPILDSMRAEASLVGFLLAVFVAVITAPVSEEFAFRVLLQGWLEAIPGRDKSAVLFGASSDTTAQDEGEAVAAKPSFPPSMPDVLLGQRSGNLIKDGEETPVLVAQVVEPLGPESSPAAERSMAMAPASVDAPAPYSNLSSVPAPTASPPWWPALVSGTLFGLAHWEYGLSFIPLIVFGVALGVVYRARQSIWPCLVMHMMLNAISMASMGVQLLVWHYQQ
ncbi:MAG: hypothetical protein KatS3mg111_3916 [Pirellulaceae bacterium]|nr:MAG: hypothetical protein KatS3mg111_3916 [Pirellulaceae bacterium]